MVAIRMGPPRAAHVLAGCAGPSPRWTLRGLGPSHLGQLGFDRGHRHRRPTPGRNGLCRPGHRGHGCPDPQPRSDPPVRPLEPVGHRPASVVLLVHGGTGRRQGISLGPGRGPGHRVLRRTEPPRQRPRGVGHDRGRCHLVVLAPMAQAWAPVAAIPGRHLRARAEPCQSKQHHLHHAGAGATPPPRRCPPGPGLGPVGGAHRLPAHQRAWHHPCPRRLRPRPPLLSRIPWR